MTIFLYLNQNLQNENTPDGSFITLFYFLSTAPILKWEVKGSDT